MTKGKPRPISARRLRRSSARVFLAVGLLTLLGGLLSPHGAAASDPRHYTYYNPNPTFVGDFSGVEQVNSGGTRLLRLQRKRLWRGDAGEGAQIESVERVSGGGVLLTDSAGGKVRLLSSSGAVTWEVGPGDLAELVRPVHAGALASDGAVLVTDAGSNAVLLVSRARLVEWRYGPDDDGALEGLTSASLVPGSGNVLITDTEAGRVFEVDPDKQIVWSSLVAGRPRDAQRLSDGRTLVVDEAGHRVVILSPTGDQVVWQYGETDVAGSGMGHLDTPVSAELLSDGSILIADAGNGRIVQVSPVGDVVEVADADGEGSEALAFDPLVGARSGNRGILAVSADRRFVFEYGYPASGTYETGDLDFGIPASKWITDVYSAVAAPQGTTVKIHYKTDGGGWKQVPTGAYQVPGPKSSLRVAFKVEMSTTDVRVSPLLGQLNADFYLAKPPIYEPEPGPKNPTQPSPSGKPNPTGDPNPLTVEGGKGTGSSGGSGKSTTGNGSGNGSAGGQGSGGAKGSGSTSSASGATSSQGAPMTTVATNVTAEEASVMLSGWVMEETGGAVSNERGSATGDAALADVEGLLVALTMVALAYGTGISSPKLASFGTLMGGPLKTTFHKEL